MPWPTGGDAIARGRDGSGDANAWADQEHEAVEVSQSLADEMESADELLLLC